MNTFIKNVDAHANNFPSEYQQNEAPKKATIIIIEIEFEPNISNEREKDTDRRRNERERWKFNICYKTCSFYYRITEA